VADLRSDAGGIVLVTRVDRGEAAVPSRVVNCSDCQAPCWLSLRTGDSTLATARLIGGGQEPRLLCLPCLELSVANSCALCKRERCLICNGCDCPGPHWCVHG
jgi:hypothetical protein